MDEEKEEQQEEEKEQLGGETPSEEEEEQQPKDNIVGKAVDAYQLYKMAKAAKTAKNISQLKILASIGAALAPMFLVMVKIIVLISLIVLVMALMLYFISTIYGMGDQIYNYFAHGTFEKSEHVFIETIEDEHRRYNRFPHAEDELDIPLILATVNYGRILDPGGLNFEDFEDMGDFFSDEEAHIGRILPADRINAFYRLMNNELGEVYTLNFMNRKLLAHLVGLKFGTKCVPAPTFSVWDWEGSQESIEDFAFEVFNSIEEFKKLLETWIDLDDVPLEEIPEQAINNLPLPLRELVLRGPTVGVITTGVALGIVIAYNIHDHAVIGGSEEPVEAILSYLSHEYEGFKVRAKTQFPTIMLKRMIEASAEDETTCGSGEWGLPTLVLYQDYELYRKYLVDYFIPAFYFDCPGCEYRDIPKDDPMRAILINRMADEIFMMRDLYTHFLPVDTYDDYSLFAFPGMASFIVDPANCYANVTLETIMDSSCMTSSYGPRPPIKVNGVTSDFHQGIDFGQPEGSPVFAMASGTVTVNSFGRSYGHVVYIDHGEIEGTHYLTRYAHFVQRSPLQVGEQVQGGDFVGFIGETGYATGAHLHFEIWVDGAHVDPDPYLRAIVDGTSDFDVGGSGQYYLMSDYDAPYCTEEETVADFGQLPTAYAILASNLNKKVNPNEIATYICENMPDEKENIIWAPEARQEFNIISEEINANTNSIKAALLDDKMVLLHVGHGPFNLRGDNYLVVTDYYKGSFLIMDPMDRTNTKGYTEQEMRSSVIDRVIDNNIWAFQDAD